MFAVAAMLAALTVSATVMAAMTAPWGPHAEDGFVVAAPTAPGPHGSPATDPAAPSSTSAPPRNGTTAPGPSETSVAPVPPADPDNAASRPVPDDHAASGAIWMWGSAAGAAIAIAGFSLHRLWTARDEASPTLPEHRAQARVDPSARNASPLPSPASFQTCRACGVSRRYDTPCPSCDNQEDQA